MLRSVLLRGVLGFFLLSSQWGVGQTTVTWRTDGPSDGKWLWGSTCELEGSSDGQWFYEIWGGFRQAPDCFGSHDVFFKGNGINTMELNGRNFGVRSITFESGASADRTLNAQGLNRLFFNNNNGLPTITNNSSANHVFNTPITLNATLFVRPNSGNLSFGQIDLQSNFIDVEGNSSREVNFNGVISGSGGLATKNSGVTTNLTAQNTFTGALSIENGILRLNRTGGTTIPASNEVIVNGGTLRISTNQTLSNLTLTSGGLTVDAGATLTLNQNITIPDGFTITNNGTIVIQGTLTDSRTTKTFEGTVSFNGSSQQTIAAATTFSNLTINNTAGVKASGDITVNGVLNLASANPNATDGALDMVIAYGTYGTVSKLDPNNFNSTLEHNNLNSYVLNLGATATVTGEGDVTGKVSRTQTFVNNTTYAFSNANMTLNFTDGGSASNLPTKVTVISTRGTKGLHADKDVADNGNPAIGGAAVQRLWQILRTGGQAAARFTVRFPYQDTELNGNTEGNLVTWDHHLDNPAYAGITPHEHGKTNNDATNNFVELANHSLFYLTTEGSTTNTKYWMLSDQITTNNTWLGAADIPAGQSNWNSTSNWTSGVAPTANDHVVIEPVGVAARNPEFVSGSYSFGSMEIKSGAEVDAGAATITLNNGPATAGNVTGSWLNNGTFNAGTSTVIFNAGVDNLATLAGNTNFHNVTVNTGKTLRLEQNAVMRIAGTLTVNGALDATQSENTVVFNGTTDQTVPATTTDNSSAAYHTLELAGAGVKSFEATPSIKGNLIKSGTSTVTIPSQFNFNGTAAQSIAGFDYNNIEFSEAGTKTFTSAASVSPTAAITFAGTPGAVDFDGSSDNLTFVLKSDTNGTARVADASNWNLNGKVTAERFVPNRRAWRLLTAPTKGSTSNTVQDNWQGTNGEGVLLWGPSGIGLAVGPQSNIYSYNGAWTPVTNTTTTTLFDTDKNNAFLVFAVGPHGGNNIASTNAAVETTLRPKGSLITGNVNYTGLTTNAFQLIANPYASPISTSALKTTNSGFNIWLLDPSLGTLGGYYTYDGNNWTPETPAGDAVNIQSGQGFFVRSASASSFTINESHKAVGNSNAWFDKPSVQTTEENKIRVLLDKQENNQWQLVDGILSVSGNNYANEVDTQDALKVSNFNENILFRNGTSNLAIEYQNLPTTATEQPIRLTGTTATAYRLRVKTESFVSVNVQPILQDTQSGTNHLIPTDGSTIEIPFTGEVATTTNPDQRFKIVYQQVLGVDQPITNTLQVYPNPVIEGQFTVVLPNPTEVATYEITNYLGQVVQKGELAPSNPKVSVAHQAAGVYLVKMQQNGLVYTTKIVKK